MNGEALGFAGRGVERKVAMPFNKRADSCKLCRGCDYVCPAMVVPCGGVKEEGELCGRCLRPEDLADCCPSSTFGYFCEKNPL